MLKLDHLVLPGKDRQRSRDWYVQRLGMKVEWDERTMKEKDET